MINMIKADLYRIFKNPGIYIAFAGIIFMIAISIYAVSPGYIGQVSISGMDTGLYDDDRLEDMSDEELSNLSMSNEREIMLKYSDYKLDRGILSTNMNLYYFFIFTAALAITADFSAGCAKNTLSSSISRTRYFASKTIIILGLCILIFFMNTYISYFANLIFNGKKFASSLWTVTKISLLQLPPILALVSILSGIAFTVKKTSIYNMVTIPLIVVFQLLFAFAVQILRINKNYAAYELQIMLGKLANNPSGGYMLRSYIICAVIIAAFGTMGYLSFKKAEIK